MFKRKQQDKASVQAKITMKVRATTRHFDGFGKDTYLCVEPVGSLEVLDFIPMATLESEGLMSPEDKSAVEYIKDVKNNNYDYINKRIDFKLEDINDYVDFQVEKETADIPDKVDKAVEYYAKKVDRVSEKVKELSDTEIKAHDQRVVYITQDEYNVLVEDGTVEDGVEYNIFEDQ